MSVKINHITKVFKDTRALDDVNVEIADGEFIAILGPSGCGKTTLLRTVGGFIQPSGGTVEVDGRMFSSEDICLPVEQRNLGMVFQSFALWPHLTVRENIEFPLHSRRNQSLSEAERTAAVRTAVESMGLKNMTEKLPGELSGGQRQRVALARAIVEKPRLLLMDEPLSALDAELKISMRKEIQDIHHLTGATILYVTHDQSEALAMADRIIIMKDGKIEQIGTPREIYAAPKTIFAATFVSKCNLVGGEWHGERFYARGSDGNLTPFACGNVGDCFRERGVFPVRPEDFSLSREGQGLLGVVTNCQFNGREIHYKIKCGTENFTVYAGLSEAFANGETVVLRRREASHGTAV